MNNNTNTSQAIIEIAELTADLAPKEQLKVLGKLFELAKSDPSLFVEEAILAANPQSYFYGGAVIQFDIAELVKSNINSLHIENILVDNFTTSIACSNYFATDLVTNGDLYASGNQVKGKLEQAHFTASVDLAVAYQQPRLGKEKGLKQELISPRII